MSINWVMLNQDGEIVKLPDERIFYKVRSRISLDVSPPRYMRNVTTFSLKSESGLVYITTKRVIYLPATPTESFKSFHAPIPKISDSRVVSAWIGPWSWVGNVRPVDAGGIPPDIPYAEMKLTFHDGGHELFREKFETIRERLHFAAVLQQETGQVIPTSEDLPRYDSHGPAGAAPDPRPTGESTQTSASHQEQARATPDEPPPDYEEAQAQAVSMGLEGRLREEAERQ